MDFFSALSLYPPHAHLVLRGELDVFAAVQLRHRLDDAVARGCICFTVDASAVTFLDAGGLGALVRLNNTVRLFGGTVAVDAASSRFRQIAVLAGLAEAFGLHLLAEASPAPCSITIARRGVRGRTRPLSVVPPRSGDVAAAPSVARAR